VPAAAASRRRAGGAGAAPAAPAAECHGVGLCLMTGQPLVNRAAGSAGVALEAWRGGWENVWM
jgi:hypothetical protein